MTSDSRHNAIRELAYAKWEQAGWPSGDGIQFWLQAEQELNIECPCDETECSTDLEHSTNRNASTSVAFAPVDPPPLALPKSRQSRKKVG